VRVSVSVDSNVYDYSVLCVCEGFDREDMVYIFVDGMGQTPQCQFETTRAE
jgi:hypothetical protein